MEKRGCGLEECLVLFCAGAEERESDRRRVQEDGVGISSGRVLRPGHARPAKRPRLGDANVGWAMACAGRMHLGMHLGGEGGGRRRSVGVRMRDAPRRACGDEASWRGRACVLELQCNVEMYARRRPSLPSPSPPPFRRACVPRMHLCGIGPGVDWSPGVIKPSHQAKSPGVLVVSPVSPLLSALDISSAPRMSLLLGQPGCWETHFYWSPHSTGSARLFRRRGFGSGTLSLTTRKKGRT